MPTSGKAPAAESAPDRAAVLRRVTRIFPTPFGGSGSRDDLRVARQAMELRGWAISALSGTHTEEMARRAGAVSAAAWRAFLAVERCAAALGQRPGVAAVLDTLPREARGAFEQARLREVQRSMSARMHMVTLSRLARRRHTPVVVLKGGVAVAEGEPVHVADLDVLVPEDQALALGDALRDEGGFRQDGADHLDGHGGHHLAPRYVPEAVQVEVHFALVGLSASEVLARAVPLAGAAGLLRPDDESHLFHTVFHAVVHHPERMGRLRDLLLIARSCTSDATCAAVVRRLRSHVGGSRAEQLVEFARRVRSGTAGADPFTEMAAANYLLAAWLQRTGREEPRLLLASVCALLNGRGEYRRLCAEQVRTLRDHPTMDAAGALARMAPSLFRPLRFLWRAAGIAGAAPHALSVVRRARRLAHAV
jgi:hypothetical protein